MKKTLQNSLLTLIALTSISNLLAYEYDFNNNTDIPLIIKIRPWGVSKDFYQIVPVEGSVKQVWEGAEGGHCIGSIEWAVWKGTKADYQSWASDRGRIPLEKQRAFGDQWRTSMNGMEMRLEPNEAYDMIVANSKSLATGIDTLLCKAVELADKTGAFTKLLQGNLTGPVDKLQQLGANAAGSAVTSALSPSGAPARPSTPAPTTKPSSTPTSIDIKNSIINTSFDTSYPSEAESNSSLEGGYGSEYGSGAPARTPSPCSFGIGQITEAAAEIAGNTNCKSRVYDIVFKLDNNDNLAVDKRKRPLRPILYAITRKGE